jgi:D-alanine-D-alanine ligase-like ATP-grasp enzyme
MGRMGRIRVAEIEEQKKRIIIEKGVEVDVVEADVVEADALEADVVEADEIRKLRKHILS